MLDIADPPGTCTYRITNAELDRRPNICAPRPFPLSWRHDCTHICSFTYPLDPSRYIMVPLLLHQTIQVSTPRDAILHRFTTHLMLLSIQITPKKKKNQRPQPTIPNAIPIDRSIIRFQKKNLTSYTPYTRFRPDMT